jgi:hypothetical protein
MYCTTPFLPTVDRDDRRGQDRLPQSEADALPQSHDVKAMRAATRTFITARRFTVAAC